ncbi:synaptic vesicle glycoprotein 2C-like [Ptychodera flava]|uniref:synaptic vesicle glycoprotein 2C-like n=1 Tax=Ptychodera flava TaxID=63121 RepID=UPI00396A53B9
MAEGGVSEDLHLVTKGCYQSPYTYTSTGDNDSEVEVDLSDLILERRYQGPVEKEPVEKPQTNRPIQNAAVRQEEKNDEKLRREVDLANAYETALSEAGFGWFQWKLSSIIGLALAADAVEVYSMGYVIPSAEKDLCLDDMQKGWLGGMVFLGMLIGAILWGNLADVMGRRNTLICCLVVNAAFAFGSSFVQTFGIFVLCRLGAGIGIGGSIPISCSYYGELVPKEGRGRRLSWLQSFYLFGNLFAAAMGLAIIPETNFTLEETKEEQFHRWRIFVMVCSVPCVLSVVFLTFMPESPRYLLHIGKWQRAVDILTNIYKANHKGLGEEGFKRNCTEIYKFSSQVKPAESLRGTCLQNVCNKFCEIFETFMCIFQAPFVWITTGLIICWFTTAFGVYGLTLWFPEYIKRLEIERYYQRTETISNDVITNISVTGELVNTHYVNITFVNATFEDAILRNVNFNRTEFVNVLFKDTLASGTYFFDCDFYNTTFNHTNLYSNKFIDSSFDHLTQFTDTVQGCQLDFSFAYNPSVVYREILVATLGGIPGVIVSALLMERLGAKIIFVASMIMSSISVFFIWLVDDEVSAVVMLGIVQLFGQAEWNSLDVMSVVFYPTDKRTSAFGFLTALARVGAVLGNVAFGRFLSVSKAIPILIVAGLFLFGGGMSVKLPNTRGIILM